MRRREAPKLDQSSPRRRITFNVVQKMITRNEIVGAILDACPSFKPGYAALCADGDAELTYIVLGRFACHLVELHQTGSEGEFFDVAELIERMHNEGDEYVREAATIGLLEGIQNYSGGGELDLVYFRSILRPESQRWWDSINKFWQKEIPFVGADLQTENPMHNNKGCCEWAAIADHSAAPLVEQARSDL